MRWARYPFLRFTIALSFGIWVGDVLKCEEVACYFLLLIIIAFAVFIHWKSNGSESRAQRNLGGFLGIVSISCIGFIISYLNYRSDVPKTNLHDLANVSHYCAKIDSRAVKTAKATKYTVILEKLKISSKWHDCQEKAVLYFSGIEGNEFDFGDRLLINGELRPFQKQTNPHAFDYSVYMQRRGLYL